MCKNIIKLLNYLNKSNFDCCIEASIKIDEELAIRKSGRKEHEYIIFENLSNKELLELKGRVQRIGLAKYNLAYAKMSFIRTNIEDIEKDRQDLKTVMSIIDMRENNVHLNGIPIDERFSDCTLEELYETKEYLRFTLIRAKKTQSRYLEAKEEYQFEMDRLIPKSGRMLQPVYEELQAPSNKQIDEQFQETFSAKIQNKLQEIRAKIETPKLPENENEPNPELQNIYNTRDYPELRKALEELSSTQ